MTAPITPDERAEWRALADAATQWPWEATQNDLTDEIGVVHDQEHRVEVAFTGMPHDKGAQADAEFIAAARTAVPRLLDALDTAEAETANAREACRTLGRIVEQQCIDIAKITRSEHLVTEDGDADWAAIWDRGHELADRAEKAEAEVARLRDEAARPAPVWDEDTVTEAVARAMFPHFFTDDRQPLRVFTETRSDAELREAERESARHRARQALAVVREHAPVSGESRATVQAEALHDAAEAARRCWTGGTNLPDPCDPEAAYSFDRWLDARADRLNPKETGRG